MSEQAIQDEQAARWHDVLDRATERERYYVWALDAMLAQDYDDAGSEYLMGRSDGWRSALTNMRRLIVDKIERTA